MAGTGRLSTRLRRRRSSRCGHLAPCLHANASDHNCMKYKKSALSFTAKQSNDDSLLVINALTNYTLLYLTARPTSTRSRRPSLSSIRLWSANHHWARYRQPRVTLAGKQSKFIGSGDEWHVEGARAGRLRTAAEILAATAGIFPVLMIAITTGAGVSSDPVVDGWPADVAPAHSDGAPRSHNARVDGKTSHTNRNNARHCLAHIGLVRK